MSRKSERERKRESSAIDHRTVSFEWIETMMLGSNNPSAYLLGSSSAMLHDESFSDDNGR